MWEYNLLVISEERPCVIRFYKHSEIDRESWNRRMAHALNSTIFCDYDLLTIANPQWGALIDSDTGATMPLPFRTRFGIPYVYSPFFLMRLGIMASCEISEKMVENFAKSIPARFMQTELVLNEANPTGHIAKHTKEMVSHRLDLSPSYPKIFESYTSNHKRNLRTAQKCSLTLDFDIPVQNTVSLFQNNRGQDKKIKIRNVDYGFFLEMCNLARERQLLDSIGARDEAGRLLAAATFLRDRNKIYFWFSGRDQRYADKRAMFFLMDHYIQQNAGSARTLDFCGSRDENVARFYAGFGGQRFTYPRLVLRNPILTPAIQLYKLFR